MRPVSDHRITIHALEKTVSVDGEAYTLEDFAWPEGLISLAWDPSLTLAGQITKQGDAYRFNWNAFEYNEIERYFEAWKIAKAKADAAREEQRLADIAKAKAEQEEQEKAEAAAREAMEAQRPLFEAQSTLANTDFKIIKAMEAKLIAEGALDPDLVAKREAARQTIRDSKA